MQFDPAYLAGLFPKMVNCFLYTLLVIVVTVILSFLIGVIITAARLRRIPVLSQVCEVWLSFVRSMPILVTLFLVYFALPNLLSLLGMSTDNWSMTTFVLVAIVFQYSPFMSEVLRPSYLAVEKGQHEAAASIGMTGWQSFLRVSAPQTLPIALPQLGTTIIRITMDTSLMFTIGVVDLMGQAHILISTNHGIHKLETYIAVAVCYWILTILATVLIRVWEKRYERFHISSGVKA